MPTTTEILKRRREDAAWDEHMRQARASEAARLEAERLKAQQPAPAPEPPAVQQDGEKDG